MILWIRLGVMFINLHRSIISRLNSLFDSIKFEEHPKNTLILRGFDPYLLLYSLIREFNLKLMSLKNVLT